MSEYAIELIKAFEGFSSKPYLCPAGIPTIGYGCTKYPSGVKVRMTDHAITRYDAEEMLLHEISFYRNAVLSLVKVPLTECQLSALISFTYNLGTGRLKASTLLRKLNRADYQGASNEFTKWVFAGRKKLRGLELRRKAEQKLFRR